MLNLSAFGKNDIRGIYGEDITEDEKKTAKDIIQGNAENFDADFEGVYFYKSKDELKGLKL